MTRTLPYLEPTDPCFPEISTALRDPDGLLAAGGSLSVPWLVQAYANGIFPWFDDDSGPILWWSPRRRAVIRPGTMHVSRSLKKKIRRGQYSVSVDLEFDAVVEACSEPRQNSSGTWITQGMRKAYESLHSAGYAHSLEVYQDSRLVGGIYGVSLGAMFFGESMFSRVTDASKIAFYELHRLLNRWDFSLIDCQIQNPHLESLGVIEISRTQFREALEKNRTVPTRYGPWRLENV